MSDLSALSDGELTRLYRQSTESPAASDGPLRITVRPSGVADRDPATLSDAELVAAYKASQPPSQAGDVAKSFGSGLVQGAASLAGLPGDIAEYGARGIDRATQFIGRQLGIDVTPRPDRAPTYGSSDIRRGIEDRITGPLYEPKTTLGKYAGNVGEFVPGALAGPGGAVRNLINFAVVPGLASEAAGQATHGTAAEPYARAATALAAGGTAALANRSNVAGKTVASATRGVTRAQVDEAERLFVRAQDLGIPITRAEALQQVTGGSTRLGDVQRVVEGSGEMRPFLAQRADQVETAGRRTFDSIAPMHAGPSTIGSAAGRAAEETLTDVRRVINDAARPFYDAAATVRLTPQEMAQARALPGYAEAAQAIRNDPQLARYVAGLPENSVGFLNEVKKQLDQSARNATAPIGPRGAPNAQVSAGYINDAAAARRIGINASPAYEIALNVESQARRDFLDPLLQGPLGKLAERDITTQRAIDTLFPRNPLPNSADEIATTVTALSRRNPNAARSLVRAHVESTFNQATRALQGGDNQWGGAGFAAALRGNAQQAENLEAAIRALPAGDRTWQGFDRFLQILEAQGQRQRIGSQTAFNQEMQTELRRGGVVGEAVTLAAGAGLKWPTRVKDAMERWRLGSNVNELAHILTDPQGGPLFRQLALARDGRQARGLAVQIAVLGKDALKQPAEPRNNRDN